MLMIMTVVGVALIGMVIPVVVTCSGVGDDDGGAADC